jgi:hypothetical protein
MMVCVIVASVAVTACALVAIAYMFGWIGAHPPATTPASFALPGQQVSGTAPDVALSPGETLVNPAPPAPPARTPAPTIPSYARRPEVPPRPTPRP